MIGVNNWWLFTTKIPMDKHEAFLKEAGVEGIEIAWGYQDLQMLELPKLNFDWISLHLPIDLESIDSNFFSELKKINDKHALKSLVIHPDRAPESFLKQLGEYPLAIENMDAKKKSGFDIKELDEIISRYEADFVLDVQHAFEHDETMSYALELFDEFRHCLSHCHVSGESDKRHELVHKADNKEEIVRFLKKVKKFPWICEGEYTGFDDLKREVDFFKELR